MLLYSLLFVGLAAMCLWTAWEEYGALDLPWLTTSYIVLAIFSGLAAVAAPFVML